MPSFYQNRFGGFGSLTGQNLPFSYAWPYGLNRLGLPPNLWAVTISIFTRVSQHKKNIEYLLEKNVCKWLMGKKTSCIAERWEWPNRDNVVSQTVPDTWHGSHPQLAASGVCCPSGTSLTRVLLALSMAFGDIFDGEQWTRQKSRACGVFTSLL